MFNLAKFIFPNFCLGCKAEIASYGLCQDCFKEVSFYTPNSCLKCGLEFEWQDSFAKVCAACIYQSPLYDRHISCVDFKAILRKIIIDYKYYDQQINHQYLVNLLLQKISYFEEYDIICAVPMYWKKLFFRNFNQAAYLARALAKAEAKPFYPLLVKKRNTMPQMALSLLMRKENLKGSIEINNKYDIKGKKILLVDDVYTTGSTLNECTKVLKKAGASCVYCLTVARRQQK